MVEYELARGPKVDGGRCEYRAALGISADPNVMFVLQGFQALNVTGPNGSAVQGDPLARMPLSMNRWVLFTAAECLQMR